VFLVLMILDLLVAKFWYQATASWVVVLWDAFVVAALYLYRIVQTEWQKTCP